MKVLSYDGALVSMSFVADEVKPPKALHLPALLKAIGQKYSAHKIPTIEEARETGAKFENGVFVVDGREIAISVYVLHNDGLSVTTSDTSDSEIVLNDLMGFMKESFGFREPTHHPKRHFQSDLVVKFDNDPSAGFQEFKKFFDFIETAMSKDRGSRKNAVAFSGMAFGVDPTTSNLMSDFSIIRRINVPWNMGLYFSKAHMTTQNHIRALTLLDDLMG